MGDSGTFGSRSTMDSIYRSQNKPKAKSKVNPNIKKQLTGKIMLTKAMKPFGK